MGEFHRGDTNCTPKMKTPDRNYSGRALLPRCKLTLLSTATNLNWHQLMSKRMVLSRGVH
jgi:hypothetical protein